MSKFAVQILDWFEKNGRHNLPWQTDPTPYRTWISEIMLQQTQVATVIPYFERFIQCFPDIETLATASLDEVLHLWSGLGYYARARNIHKSAQLLNKSYQNKFPDDFDLLLQLPGIGRSTAGAILALACQQRHPILDGNVKRVLTRFHAVAGWPGQAKIEKKLWKLADKHTPLKCVAEYTQAIMDLGATVCLRRNPECGRCPVNEDCVANRRNEQNIFPAPRPRKPLPVRHSLFIIFQNKQGEILMEKRPPHGIWGGLWSFPECKSESDLENRINQNLGYKISDILFKPMIRHTFSHFHLDITPVTAKISNTVEQIRDNEHYRWQQIENLEGIGVPTPVMKILEELNEQDSLLRKAG